MGILDDAIREHLELKRQHGVPEEEVQRQEEEALGPARRDVAQQPEDSELAPGQPAAEVAEGAGDAAPSAIAEAEHGPPDVEQETALFDMERDSDDAEVPPAPGEPAAPQTAVHEGPEAEEPPVEPTLVEPPPTEPTPVEPPPVEPPPVEPPPVEPPPVEDELEDETELVEESERAEETGLDEDEGEDDEDLLASDPEDDELDVLEDTPDFLQETPEHDRLWFEQKPPRDFDFD